MRFARHIVVLIVCIGIICLFAGKSSFFIKTITQTSGDSEANDQKTRTYVEKYNQEELQRFKEFMFTWPQNKPKAIIYFLIYTKAVLFRIEQTVKQLDKHFNHKYNYPVLIFHEGDLTTRQKAMLSPRTDFNIFYQQVLFQVPAFIKSNVNQYLNEDCPMKRLGYRHMCRFHFCLVYQNSIMQQMDWYWRLDDDSQILADINYDLFQFMVDKKLTYGYAIVNGEPPQCIQGLRTNVTKYAHDNGIQYDREYFEAFLKPFGWSSVIYNNFEISSVKFWQSEAVQKFIDYIDHTGGIYYKRWGDAPLKTVTLLLFLPQAKWHNFSDIFYRHSTFHTQGEKLLQVEYLKTRAKLKDFMKLAFLPLVSTLSISFIVLIYAKMVR